MSRTNLRYVATSALTILLSLVFSYSKKIRAAVMSLTISLSVRWRWQLTSSGKPPLRLAFGTDFRLAKRNGANSLFVCRNHELRLPIQRVSAGLPLVIRRRPNSHAFENSELVTPPLAALNNDCELHFV